MEKLFIGAAAQKGYNEYFYDRSSNNFGHCATQGNKLLAEDIADVILDNFFINQKGSIAP
ncbi:MAG: hypothetical protein KAS66_13380 [Candidatus Omnitrophica bacterium]|nr:hypothetical protein [Candidatus Omnitrophota bacterium]